MTTMRYDDCAASGADGHGGVIHVKWGGPPKVRFAPRTPSDGDSWKSTIRPVGADEDTAEKALARNSAEMRDILGV